MSRLPILAIDGPAGAGKSTVARGAAKRLGLIYIDTGAMYRGVAWEALRREMDLADVDALSRLAGSLHFAFAPGESQDSLRVDGEDVGEAIRRPEISDLASKISTIGGVREALVRAQRVMGNAGGVVMEGRDITTVVFPDADIKIYLDARPEERARRRQADLARQGRDVSLEQVLSDISERDERDSTRAKSPLRRADDAVYLCTDGMGLDDVIERVTQLVAARTRH